jgi:hypothetical protein
MRQQGAQLVAKRYGICRDEVRSSARPAALSSGAIQSNFSLNPLRPLDPSEHRKIRPICSLIERPVELSLQASTDLPELVGWLPWTSVQFKKDHAVNCTCNGVVAFASEFTMKNVLN